MMISAPVAGVAVPLWDRDVMQSLIEAAEGLASDHTTPWQFGVINDEGEVDRRIVAENSTECVKLVDHFSKLQFKRVKVDGQPVMRKQPFSET